jgi:hypothetical protein
MCMIQVSAAHEVMTSTHCRNSTVHPLTNLHLGACRYQLIYAWGTTKELPSQQARAQACQALLHILSRCGQEGGRLATTLSQEGVAVWTATALKPGAFRGLRLLPGQALDAALPVLRGQLAEALVEAPPYALRWMGEYPRKVSRQLSRQSLWFHPWWGP